MTDEAYQRAMFAPITKPLELDCDPTTETWPMPEPRKWTPVRDESMLARAARIMDATWGFLSGGRW
jgi:hypothetical protein